MNKQEVDQLIEEHYEHYILTIMDKLDYHREKAMELLHDLYTKYVNPFYADRYKFGGPYTGNTKGQIRVWDQYIHMACKGIKSGRRKNIHRK